MPAVVVVVVVVAVFGGHARLCHLKTFNFGAFMNRRQSQFSRGQSSLESGLVYELSFNGP